MEKYQSIFLIITFICYLAASICYGWQTLFTRKIRNSLTTAAVGEGYGWTNGNNDLHLGSYLTRIGFLANTASLVIRYLHTGHPPLGNMYEFLLFFIWGIVLIYIIVEYKYKLQNIGIFALPMVFILTAWLILMDSSPKELMPALRSKWLYFHVFTAVVSYGAFAVSFIIGLVYLLKDNYLKKGKSSQLLDSLPEINFLEELTYKLIVVGMPFLTLVIITGAIWAEMSWGTYWSWDPKETWSLITWFIYAGYLHTRLIKNWKGKKSIILVVIGFLAVLFTFAGVNILLPGLHSYA
ncbi:MAG: c-type cytochrome biogenesis protein CcsB [Bacillota bacterium]